ncbi:MAG TPA: hypothetical protein VGG14_03325 [Candidatus Sulfotelmatobacter sp.]|jgi:hypothetical protein
MAKKGEEKYTLTSAAKPHISDGGKDVVQADILYKCLEPYGSIHTLEGLIVAAKSRNYESTFKRENSATVRESLLYHLNRFKKNGIVRFVEDTPDLGGTSSKNLSKT